MTEKEKDIFLRNREMFHPVVPFDPMKEKLLPLDFTSSNTELTADIIENTGNFSDYIHRRLAAATCKYGIGGYAEHRTVYSRSGVFDADEASDEPRRLHLGVDIWGAPGTPVYSPLAGHIHSFAFNNHYGDYGATLILAHELEGFSFHSLYGHISKKDIENISKGQLIKPGQEIAHFGIPEENGHWPPHLHMQLIIDLENNEGDYIGVCRYSERQKYLANCPDPDLVIRMKRYLV